MIGSSFGQQLAQYQTSFLVEERVLASPATSVTFSNLNALRDGGYTLDILTIANTTGQPNINLIVNGDTNTANYTGRMMYASSNTALGLTTTTRISSIAPSVGQLCASFTDIAFAGGKISVYTRATDQFPEVFVIGTQYTPSVSNLTSLTIECATASGMGAGTIIRLYRKLNGNTATFTPLQSNLVADILVPSATTQVDITGLDSNLHGGYTILADVSNATASSSLISCYVNDDITPANYYTQQINAASTSISSTRYNTNRCIAMEASVGAAVFGMIEVSLGGGDKCRISSTTSRGSGSGITIDQEFCSKVATVSNVTKLSFVAAVASSIAAGSRFSVYRRK